MTACGGIIWMFVVVLDIIMEADDVISISHYTKTVSNWIATYEFIPTMTA